MLEKIRSTYIIDIIFNNLRNKRKLNIIKYNKKTIFRLNIKEEDFKVYSFLKEFNEKYNSNIEDIDIFHLGLRRKNLGNEGLKCLSKIKFKELKYLDLSYNRISDINALEKFNIAKLEILILNFNQISNRY